MMCDFSAVPSKTSDNKIICQIYPTKLIMLLWKHVKKKYIMKIVYASEQRVGAYTMIRNLKSTKLKQMIVVWLTFHTLIAHSSIKATAAAATEAPNERPKMQIVPCKTRDLVALNFIIFLLSIFLWILSPFFVNFF